MAIDIEKKFIVTNVGWKNFVKDKFIIKQAYLSENNQITTIIRIISDNAYLTIKGVQINISRQEFEYKIPMNDAEQLFLLSSHQIFKTRYILGYLNDELVIDVFEKNLFGLIIAEIELKRENQKFVSPTWIGEDVSYDLRCQNLNLGKLNKIPKLNQY